MQLCLRGSLSKIYHRIGSTVRHSFGPTINRHPLSTQRMDGKSKQYIFTGTDRQQYTKGELDLSHIDTSSPFSTFQEWYKQAKDHGITADAVCLSTAELPSGSVSSRMVLLKELDDTGFVIYSNFGTSRKSKDLASNEQAALCFWYEKMERSVRVEGVTQRLTEAESQTYFDTRPLDSRIGAWASPQSSVIEDRQELDDHVAITKQKFNVQEGQDQKIPVPTFWGGLRIVPNKVEFWSGRNNRLHDRLVMTRNVSDVGPQWSISRLAP